MAGRFDEEQDDYDDAPRKKSRRRDDDDRPDGGEFGPLDKLFMDTAFPILILFGICCGMIALILAIICFATAKQPEAKSRALTVMICSGIITVLSIAINFASIFFG